MFGCDAEHTARMAVSNATCEKAALAHRSCKGLDIQTERPARYLCTSPETFQNQLKKQILWQFHAQVSPTF